MGGALVALSSSACGGGTQEVTPTAAIATARPTSTSNPTLPPAPTVPGAPTATPTPVPYNGKVARMQLPKFKVDAEIEAIGRAPGENQLDVPHNPHNVGWYELEGYGKPGFGLNAVFSAHVNYHPNIKGPFLRLEELEAGDDVVMEDGRQYCYRVVSKARYHKDTIPMGDLIWPSDRAGGKEWITLITCGGEFVSERPGGPGHYLHRDVVVAERYQ